MATDTETAATGLHDQLAQLYPSKTDAQLWGMVGVTEMPGIDDFGAAETFTTANATTVYNWAVAKGINTLSFWALQRDNGGCPGTGGSDSCSGITQSTWQFSHTFEPFTGGGSTTAAGQRLLGVALARPPARSRPAAPPTSTVQHRRHLRHRAVRRPDGQRRARPASRPRSAPASVTAGGSSTLTRRHHLRGGGRHATP